jgi:hypothetical protein
MDAPDTAGDGDVLGGAGESRDDGPRVNAVRVYWGCTTFHCERGFHGTEEDMPREWTHCPACGSVLTEITVTNRLRPT